MPCVKEVQYVDGYRLSILFDTGESAVVDFSGFLQRHPNAAPLKSIDQFKAFYLDGWPTLAWPCGFDIAPETLYEMATGKLPVWANQSVLLEETC
ncbi:MAG: hypothetical protein RIR18_988 [Pseudomonadota bacterium]|jgi:hypothetical protein